MLGLALSALVGCGSIRQWTHNGLKVGPNYCRPAAPLSEGWTLSEEEPFEQGTEDGEFWWRAFGGPVLDRLVHVAYQQNRSLRSAGLRVLEARAQRAVIAGNLFLQIEHHLVEVGAELSTADLPQAATLMGVIAAPNRWSPVRHPEVCVERRNRVLDPPSRRRFLRTAFAAR